MTIKITSAIFCDLVRQEISGKFILIGVYQNEVHFQKLPTPFAGSYWIEFRPWKTKGALDFEIKIDAPGQESIRQSSISFPLAEATARDDNVSIVINLTPITIESTGDLSLFVRKKGDEKWQEALVKKIGLITNPSPEV